MNALYEGHIIHHRSGPKVHRFRYPVFSLLLNISTHYPGYRSGVLGINRPSFLSFHESDHGEGTKTGLENWVRSQFRQNGLSTENCNILCLCYPRILGYVFNPLTVYYLQESSGRTRAMLLEVNNTKSERCTYLLSADAPINEERMSPESQERYGLKGNARKAMYVSPFSPVNGEYAFSMSDPGKEIRVVIRHIDDQGHSLKACFAGSRRKLTAPNLLSALLRFPLLTLKVTLAIHFEALRLWLKGTPMYPHKATQQTPHIASTLQNKEEAS